MHGSHYRDWPVLLYGQCPICLLCVCSFKPSLQAPLSPPPASILLHHCNSHALWWHNLSSLHTMCWMLQEIEVFLSCCYAIKYADIGLLHWMVDPLIVLFLGAGKVNYSHEMLFYCWLLSEKVCTLELQYAILVSELSTGLAALIHIRQSIWVLSMTMGSSRSIWSVTKTSLIILMQFSIMCVLQTHLLVPYRIYLRVHLEKRCLVHTLCLPQLRICLPWLRKSLQITLLLLRMHLSWQGIKMSFFLKILSRWAYQI